MSGKRSQRRARHRIEVLYRPGRHLSDQRLASLSGELRAIGETCLHPLPEYQCFLPGREALADKLLAVARRPDGTMDGFCSAVLLPVRGVGEVLHLGLTCVLPAGRGAGLTHRLTTRLVTSYMLWHGNPLRTIWVSNVACVLSSLGNFALHFDRVYPSPLDARPPGAKHWLIAEAFDRDYRAHAHIQDWATFDRATFVFRKSGRGTAFQKDPDDTRYHHRDPVLNRFYADLLCFEDGDELLQVGTVSMLRLVSYLAGGKRRGVGKRVNKKRRQGL